MNHLVAANISALTSNLEVTLALEVWENLWLSFSIPVSPLELINLLASYILYQSLQNPPKMLRDIFSFNLDSFKQFTSSVFLLAALLKGGAAFGLLQNSCTTSNIAFALFALPNFIVLLGLTYRKISQLASPSLPHDLPRESYVGSFTST